MACIRTIIVDDHEAARHSIRLVLAGNSEIEVVAEIVSGEEAIEKTKELDPDIVLLDIGLPGMSGIEAAASIHHESPNSRIIFVTQHASPLLAQNALQGVASGYVVKSDAGRDLLSAIKAVREGRTFISPVLIAKR